MRMTSINPSLIICTFLLLLPFSNDLLAACTYKAGSGTNILSVSPPKFITTPRDTPIGSTVFESATYMHADNTLTLCTGNDSWGVLNDRGSSPTTSALFPIGNTGLSWQYIYRGVAEKGYGYLTTAGNTTTGSIANTTAALRIVKTGDVVSGASIPAGDLGGLKYGGLRLSTIRLTDSLTITSPACQTPNVNVVMGQQRLGDIPTDGSPTKENIPFSVKLNNCPAGISKVMYTLTPTSSSPSLNSSQGIIALNQTSTAQGIGLQITDSDLTPIPLNEPKLFNDYSATGGSFVIPLNARYSRIASGSKVSPGTANAEITFVMSYL